MNSPTDDQINDIYPDADKPLHLTRSTLGDIDIAETYPKTVTLAVALPRASFKVAVYPNNTVDFIRSRGESFFPRESYLETLKDLERLIVGATDFELHKIQLTREEFRTKVTAAISFALGANPQFKGVMFIPEKLMMYDITTRPFSIKLCITNDVCEIRIETPDANYVTDSSRFEVAGAVSHVVTDVFNEIKDEVESRRLVLINIREMFKDYPNFEGVEFVDMLEA